MNEHVHTVIYNEESEKYFCEDCGVELEAIKKRVPAALQQCINHIHVLICSEDNCSYYSNGEDGHAHREMWLTRVEGLMSEYNVGISSLVDVVAKASSIARDTSSHWKGKELGLLAHLLLQYEASTQSIT